MPNILPPPSTPQTIHSTCSINDTHLHSTLTKKHVKKGQEDAKVRACKARRTTSDTWRSSVCIRSNAACSTPVPCSDSWAPDEWVAPPASLQHISHASCMTVIRCSIRPENHQENLKPFPADVNWLDASGPNNSALWSAQKRQKTKPKTHFNGTMQNMHTFWSRKNLQRKYKLLYFPEIPVSLRQRQGQ